MQKEPRQRSNAVLTNIDTDEHSIAQKHLDRSPCQTRRLLCRAGTRMDIYQSPALLDELDLSRINPRMRLHAIDRLVPDKAKQQTSSSHKPETLLPAPGVRNPSENRSEENSEKYCEALKIADARPRSAVGNQLATIRPFPGKTGDSCPEIRRNPDAAKAAMAGR